MTGADQKETKKSEKTILVRKRLRIVLKINRIEQYITGFDAESETLTSLNLRLTALDDAFDEFNAIHDEICALISLEDVVDEEKYNIGIETQVFRVKEQLLTTIDKLKPLEEKKPSTTNTGSIIRLPEISLPTFNGSYEQWFNFKDIFASLINDNERLSDIQRLHYLLGALRGDALRQIEKIELSAAGFNLAWASLTERYDNKRRIIEKHIAELFKLRALKTESAADLRSLIDECSMHLRALKTLDQPIQHWDMIIIHIITSRLDNETIKYWEAQIPDGNLPTWEAMVKAIHQRCNVLESIENNSGQGKGNSSSISSSSRKSQYGTPQKSSVVNTTSTFLTSRETKCWLCHEPHRLFRCAQFLNLNVTLRQNKVRELQLCFNCLQPGHQVQECSASKCKRCNRAHNTLLHSESQASSSTEAKRLQSNHGKATSIPNSSSNQNQGSPQAGSSQWTSKEHQGFNNTNHLLSLSTSNLQHQQSAQRVILSTVTVAVLDHTGREVHVRALMDSGSESNFMTEDLASRLGVNRETIFMPVDGLNGTRTFINQQTVITIKSRVSQYNQASPFYIVPAITKEVPSTHINTTAWTLPEHIELADPQFHVPNKVELLIGVSIFYKALKMRKLNVSSYIPTLYDTVFGWMFAGEFIDNFQQKNQASTTCHISNIDLSQQLEKFWQLESCDETSPASSEDNECETHFITSHSRAPDGRYIVQLPLKACINQLGESRGTALRRFYQLERRLARDKELKSQYTDFMREYIELHHMVESQPNESMRQYYLPHHAVVKPESTTTKLRVVFDASAKTTTQISLNDALMTGATVQQDLMSIVLRFRLHQYVITADIEKMYRQIHVDTPDTYLQQILWRENSEDDIKSFRLTTVTYGTASAPYCATRVLKQAAMDEQSTYPVASKIVQRDFYVDDLLTGSDDIHHALQIQDEVIKLLQSAGMKLRKWSANHPSLLTKIRMEDRETRTIFETSSNDTVKTLGLIWHTTTDHFSFKTQPHLEKLPITKRLVLSEIARLFDPLGIVGPITVTAKLIMQRLWSKELQLKWDDTIPDVEQTLWRKYIQQLETVENIQFPRHIVCPQAVSMEVHGFADASEKAYGACIYLRSISQQQQVQVSLVCSKSRVAPLSKSTIPRLELCAAMLLANLVNKVVTALELHVSDVHLYSDSTITLCWLKTPPHQLKTFVANRVATIQELTAKYEWHHIESQSNPADVLSRGVMPQELQHKSLWWKGPELLYSLQPRTEQFITPSVIPELKPVTSLHVAKRVDSPFHQLLCKFSKYNKLIHVVGYVHRFINNARALKINRTYGCLTVPELAMSELTILKHVQLETFEDEVQRLSQKKEVGRSSKLKALLPFLDEKHLIRVGGRLKNSALSFEEKHQVVLPNHHHVSKLLFHHYHLKHLHASPQLLLSCVRQRFWPINGKNMAKHTVRQCLNCFKTKPLPIHQLMGQLPPDRVKPNKPFHVCGVDYCGPVTVKYKHQRKGTFQKSYIALFVCFSTKAIHIEVVSELTSDAFIAALKRFTSRRGKCAAIHSDNGTNFVGANNELQRWVQSTQQMNPIQQFCEDEGIKWKMIPARSPHFGGLWEAAVKSFKHHFRRVTLDKILTFEELCTLTTQIEACLNSRPLTGMSNDPNDMQPLTPGHFLIGSPLTLIAEPNLEDINCNKLSRWQMVTQMTQSFWNRWNSEYLQSLQDRKKWQQTTPNIEDNMLVIIIEENIPPCRWLLGRVINVVKGADGNVRIVHVRTKTGLITRAVTRICPLPQALQPIELNSYNSTGGVC